MTETYSRLLNSDTPVSTILQQMDKYKFNPSGVQRVILDHLRDVTDGKIDIVDPTNPFVFLLESSTVNTVNFIVQNEVNTRKQYPSAAQTEDDVYIHMSDKDFVDRFASPVQTKFSIIINKNELLESLVPVPGSNYSKISIPANTEFTIADTVFSMQYAVDIKRFDHQGFQVIYDTSKASPLFTLTSNRVEWEMRTSTQTQEDWLYLEVDVHQFKVESYTNTISSVTGFVQTYEFKDQFYYARVYNKSSDTGNAWVELRTTHTDQVYDNTIPTAVLKVTSAEVEVVIPQIYILNGRVKGSIRVDIYETKGELSMALENYKVDAFEAEWRNIDNSDNTTYNAALTSIRNIAAFSNKNVNGGKDTLSFELLRQRVINNAIGDHQLPITNVQIESVLNNKGYNVITNVDVVTNRVFLATRKLPKPLDERLVTAGNASIETLVSSMSDLSTHELVLTNNKRVTLPPELVYRNINGIIRLLSKQELDNILNNTDEAIATSVTMGNYLYSPFHYVLDSNKDEFELRPYYLNKPEVSTVSFVTSNTTSSLELNTLNYNIVRNIDSYSLEITASSNDVTKLLPVTEVHAQLSFIPVGEVARAFLNGTTSINANGSFVFTFQLTTNFDIDENDTLYLNSFQMFDLAYRQLGTGLLNDFDITFSVSNNSSYFTSGSDVDVILGTNYLPAGTIGVTHEKVRISFGNALKTLWARSRSVLSSSPFQTHDVSSIKLYSEDVYEIDPTTGSAFNINALGEFEYKILHRAGEEVKDDLGNTVYNYRVGDIIKDSNGNPVPVDKERIMRQIDLMFIDGAYYFANDVASTSYKKEMVGSLVEWMLGDITQMSEKLLEQTRLYFYPKTNMGTVKVLMDNAIVTDIEAAQKLSIKLYVNSRVLSNIPLKNALSRATISLIDSSFTNQVISVSDLTSSLKDIYGDDVITVTINGLAGVNDAKTITMLNDSDRCSIGRRLTALPNNTRIVEENIDISFILHEVP